MVSWLLFNHIVVLCYCSTILNQHIITYFVIFDKTNNFFWVLNIPKRMMIRCDSIRDTIFAACTMCLYVCMDVLRKCQHNDQSYLFIQTYIL